jgi:hypothetical protein
MTATSALAEPRCELAASSAISRVHLVVTATELKCGSTGELSLFRLGCFLAPMRPLCDKSPNACYVTHLPTNAATIGGCDMYRYLTPEEHEVAIHAVLGIVGAVKTSEEALQTVLVLLDCVQVHYRQTQARPGPPPPNPVPPHLLKTPVEEMRKAFTNLATKVERIRLKLDELITEYNWTSNAPTTGKGVAGVIQRLNHITNTLRP